MKQNGKNNKNKSDKDKKDPKKKSSKGTGKGAGPKKKKDQKVYYPVVISKPDQTQEEQISEAEISYNDKLMAVTMEKLAAKGLSNNEIIKALGISRDTFYRKLREEPYFSYCLYKHREIAVKEVECALFNSALGFMYKEDHVTPMGVVVTANKYALPNVSAQKEFLHNRKPDEWRKKIENVHQLGTDIGEMNVVIRRREE